MISIVTPSKKRAREGVISSPLFLPQHRMGFQCQLRQPNMVVHSPINTKAEKMMFVPTDSGTQGHFQQPAMMVSNQANMITRTSNSGQNDIPVGFAAQVYQQCEDIDSIVRLHMEQLSSGLLEAGKRHCRSLLAVAQEQAFEQLREKEMQLEQARQRNAVLEEMVRRFVTESHFWFNIAKNNEAVARSLRASLEQALIAEEGTGETEDIVNPAAGDSQSCCYRKGI